MMSYKSPSRSDESHFCYKLKDQWLGSSLAFLCSSAFLRLAQRSMQRSHQPLNASLSLRAESSDIEHYYLLAAKQVENEECIVWQAPEPVKTLTEGFSYSFHFDN